MFVPGVRMFWLILCVLSLANILKCERSEPLVSSISDMVRIGTNMMSRFLNLKSPQAFFSTYKRLTKETKTSRTENKDQGNELILFVTRLMAGNKQKVTIFALDGLIALIHLIIQIFIRNGGKRRGERTEFSLFRFILSQPQAYCLLSQMQDPQLVDTVLKKSAEKLKYYPDKNADCIKLLICRTKPFVHEMQRSLRFFMNREKIKISGKETCAVRADKETSRAGDDVCWEKASLEDKMYFFVPSLKEVAKCGDECDKFFPNCVY